jgi:hypothetical protein
MKCALINQPDSPVEKKPSLAHRQKLRSAARHLGSNGAIVP